MSTTKIASSVHKIDSPIRDVYKLLSDFSRIGRLFQMAKQMGMGGMANNDQLAKISEQIEDIQFGEDACYIKVKRMGEVAVRIVEREEPKLIKLGGEGALPFDFNIWIQLLENAPYDTRMKITFQGELNMMMKMLLKGKLEKGIDQFAEALTKIPYGILGNFG